jgi:hypothetical protein
MVTRRIANSIFWKYATLNHPTFITIIKFNHTIIGPSSVWWIPGGYLVDTWWIPGGYLVDTWWILLHKD